MTKVPSAKMSNDFNRSDVTTSTRLWFENTTEAQKVLLLDLKAGMLQETLRPFTIRSFTGMLGRYQKQQSASPRKPFANASWT